MICKPATLSVRHCVRCLEQCFRASGVEEAKCSAQYIIAAALGKKTLNDVHPKTKLHESSWHKAKEMAGKRLKHTPIQYIVGEWDFRYLTLDMLAPVLIPRPETEELVGHVLNELDAENEATFLEAGCGSGAVSLSLLHENKQLTGTAIDSSEKACELTLRNAKKNDLDGRLNVRHISIQDYGKAVGGEKFDFVVSNPPYISTSDMRKLHVQVKDFEDEAALHGGSDGLDLIKVILQLAPDLLRTGQFRGQGAVWLEVDSSHPPLVENYIVSNIPRLSYCSTIRDVSGKTRFCKLFLNDDGPTEASRSRLSHRVLN